MLRLLAMLQLCHDLFVCDILTQGGGKQPRFAAYIARVYVPDFSQSRP